jgi:tetratricopeptide (TPR) repeat protein
MVAKVVQTVIQAHLTSRVNNIKIVNNHIMKNIVLIFTLVLIFISGAVARVKLPEFSFTGKEIGNVSVKPQFPQINIQFRTKTTIDIFLEKMKLEQKGIDSKDYKFEEPGFMYGGSFRTALASIFVGPKAYRNYMAKKFLNKEYLSVIDSYESHHEKLKGGDLENEIKLFYALSLMEMGNTRTGVPVLVELSKGNDNITYYAQDKLFEYYSKINDIDGKLGACQAIKHFSEYGLYNCLDTYYKKNMLKSVIELSDLNQQLMDKNISLNVYKIASLYILGDVKSVMGYDPGLYREVSGYIADAHLENGQIDKAQNIISKITDKDEKLFYMIKMAILKGDKNFLLENFNNVKQDNNKLFLMLYYITKKFPNVDIGLISNIKFENPIYYDYSNFYTGITLLNLKRYQEAIEYLNKISFYEELKEGALFYLAICYYYTDYGLSEVFFKKYLETGKDNEKLLLSRYMLGQFYFVDKKYDEALDIINSCSTINCDELKAEIYFNKGDFKQAITVAATVGTDRALLIAASSHFNLQEYKDALNQLKRVKESSRDSDLLLMLTYFKLSEIGSGLDVYKKYNYDREFTENAVKYLYLSGNYNEVVNILRTRDNLSGEQELILANSYFSIGKYDEAMKIYFNMIDKKTYIYESAYGIFSIAQTRKDIKSVEKLLSRITEIKFENKDILFLNMVRYLKENGSSKTALARLNDSIGNFTSAGTVKDAYLLRGYLHENLGMYDECVKDVDKVLGYNNKDEEARFLKAECLKNINKTNALEIYTSLAENSKRFEYVAKREIVNLTDDPVRVKDLLDYFKTKDDLFYYDSVVRMLGLLELRKDLPEYEKYVDELIATKSEKYVPIGYYYKSVLMYTKGDLKNALNYAMRCYYVYPKSSFAQKSVQLALQIYKKNGDEESVKKVEDILKKIEQGGK